MSRFRKKEIHFKHVIYLWGTIECDREILSMEHKCRVKGREV